MGNSIPLRMSSGGEAPAIFYLIIGIVLLFIIMVIGKLLVREKK